MDRIKQLKEEYKHVSRMMGIAEIIDLTTRNNTATNMVSSELQKIHKEAQALREEYNK